MDVLVAEGRFVSQMHYASLNMMSYLMIRTASTKSHWTPKSVNLNQMEIEANPLNHHSSVHIHLLWKFSSVFYTKFHQFVLLLKPFPDQHTVESRNLEEGTPWMLNIQSFWPSLPYKLCTKWWNLNILSKIV